MATLDENDGFVKRALENKEMSVSGVSRPDQRGKHPAYNKKPEEVRQCVDDHINSFPRYISHYGRSHSNLQYLGSGVKVTNMHKLYLENPANPIVSESYYYGRFKESGLKLKPPAIDTCQKCDIFDCSIKNAFGEEKATLEAERDAHQMAADAAYAHKKALKLVCRSDPTKSHLVISFDLQQVLPCPLLSGGNIFYLRQLSVYNLTIYESVKREAVNFMWSEVDAGRGANEIGSCLSTFISEYVPNTTRRMTCFSDTCAGQNKNSHVIAALITAVKNHPSLEVIDQKFLVPGHTFLECDQVHAQIEKEKRPTTTELHHPSQWYEFVGNVKCSKTVNNGLQVREMKQQDFLNYEALLKRKEEGPLVMKKKNVDGDPFLFAPVQWFRLRKENPTMVQYKTNLDEDSPFEAISFRRSGKMGQNGLLPKKLYSGRVPISVKKKEDLLGMKPQINPIWRDWYDALPDSPDVLDVDPDVPPEVDVSEVLRQQVDDEGLAS